MTRWWQGPRSTWKQSSSERPPDFRLLGSYAGHGFDCPSRGIHTIPDTLQASAGVLKMKKEIDWSCQHAMRPVAPWRWGTTSQFGTRQVLLEA